MPAAEATSFVTFEEADYREGERLVARVPDLHT